MGKFKIFTDGLWSKNPIFRIVLGMCPTLAVTNLAFNGLVMGIATLFVLFFSEVISSAIRKIVPDKARIPIYIVVIATFVTIVDLLLNAYLPATHKVLGVFIPLIVVNCIIMGRVEEFASKNSIIDSAIDGLGMGVGFTLSLLLIGSIREMLGSGNIFGINIGHGLYDPMVVFVMPAGAFLTLASILALMNFIDLRKNSKVKQNE